MSHEAQSPEPARTRTRTRRLWRPNLPLVLSSLALAAAPLVLPVQYVDLLVFSALLAIGALGVGFLLGQAGIINLAQVAFYGIGAYATAHVTVAWALPGALGLLIGLVISATFALAIGLPLLRLSGHFLALATLALLVIVTQLFFEWDWLTGGSLGISGIPKISLLGWTLDSPVKFYYFVWPLTLLCFWLLSNVANGRPGLAMRAMRDSPEAAEVMAIDSAALRTKLFVLSAILGSLSGSLFAHYVGYISVDSFTLERTMLLVLAAVIGGVRNPWGALPGAIFVSFLPEVLSPLGDVYRILFGVGLVLVIMLFPQGLLGIAAWRRVK
nr:branched-chain amino acid ABC transporter permease [Variovorax sp. dw_954]